MSNLFSTASLLALTGALSAQTILIDVGRQDAGQLSGAGWNNITGVTGSTATNTTSINNMIDSSNASTAIDLNIAYTVPSGGLSAGASGADYSGPYPSAVTGLAATAISDSYFCQPGGAMRMTFSDLSAFSTYKFLFYSSRGNTGGDAIFTVVGANNDSVTIANVLNNSTSAPTTIAITPNASGEILVTWTLSSGPSGLNMIQITGTPNTDTDSDGMPDSYEDANGLNKDNPADAAFDADAVGGADGLTNLEEYTLGTDPQDSDTDNDGLSDGDEVSGALNPWTGGLASAPPGDPTDPRDDDSDDDTVKDGDEITNGTDPNAPPPNSGPLFPFVDSDGDSYSDTAEIAFGSNPNDPADCPDHTPNAAKPNVVIIYADDLGFGDMSAYGDLFGTSSPALTPRMNSLATEGTLFTQAHSSNGVCTPSRYALLTGKYNWREFNGISNEYGYSGAISEIPRAADTTIAEFLKTQGYDTAAFGKWHLGGRWNYRNGNTRVTGNPSNPNTTIDWARPVEDHAVSHGFDLFRGLACTINRGPYVYMKDDRNQFWDSTLNGGAGAFRNATNSDPIVWVNNLNSSIVGIKANSPSLGDPSYRQVDAGPFMITQVEEYFAGRAGGGDNDPFFAYVSLYSPHFPQALTAPFIGSDSASGNYHADWMREVDDRIGRVIDAIDNNGFHDNTIVIFTSDNGPETGAMSQSLNFGGDPNGPLRGAKRDAWDGGTRVPFIVRWPGQAAAGMKISDVVWQGDIFATVAAFLGQELPTDVAPDGESLLNLIRGQQKPTAHRDSIVVSAFRGDLGLKTTDGWKLIDSTGGGGNGTSWDSDNNTFGGAQGSNRGSPKQLFHLTVDLGEDDNLISSLTNTTAIRNELVALTGSDLLGTLDQYRTTVSTLLFPRIADNDGDALPNSYELQYGLDPNSPKDAVLDLDGDGASNLDEFIAGTDPSDPSDVFRIIDLEDTPEEFSITWPSVSGRTYTVFWSTGLDNWTLDSIHPASTSPQSAILDKSAIDTIDGIIGNLDSLFVRVRVALQ